VQKNRFGNVEQSEVAGLGAMVGRYLVRNSSSFGLFPSSLYLFLGILSCVSLLCLSASIIRGEKENRERGQGLS
jgi:hypothetical protein